PLLLFFLDAGASMMAASRYYLPSAANLPCQILVDPLKQLPPQSMTLQADATKATHTLHLIEHVLHGWIAQM
ncbi:MAG: hypothetical protein OXF25_04440, partial [Cyanobacteria bacterium MAG CAR3_bin_5]|nr:hypothetical protein [Cyanobacteria bacterium MAG CAR3_bin_5]